MNPERASIAGALFSYLFLPS